ncbi:uncharacterized protein PG986_015018 [Apiospora aurea]|uniref:Luciferase domain-containing protein n=1 Tax=Apiospora aurea TaxID=335848 RepID=A0ABR1PRC2_9PEZI
MTSLLSTVTASTTVTMTAVPTTVNVAATPMAPPPAPWVPEALSDNAAKLFTHTAHAAGNGFHSTRAFLDLLWGYVMSIWYNGIPPVPPLHALPPPLPLPLGPVPARPPVRRRLQRLPRSRPQRHPSTVRGWLRTLRLKYMARLDVLQPPRVPPFMDPYRGRLFNLPERTGPRPTVKGVAPQRQSDQKASPSTFFRLSNMLAEEARAHPQHLNINTSFLEGHLQALRKVVPEGQPLGRDDRNGDWEFGGEIAHPHRLDGSMHVVLHPEDVRTVIEGGWGERHPSPLRRLSGNGRTTTWRATDDLCPNTWSSSMRPGLQSTMRSTGTSSRLRCGSQRVEKSTPLTPTPTPLRSKGFPPPFSLHFFLPRRQ